jgi:hypothetical protein
MRIQTVTNQEAVLFPVSLSLSVSPEQADAGAALILTATAECPEDYDLSDDPVLFVDAAGREIGSAPLVALEENDFGAEITVIASVELGQYEYSAVLMPVDGDGVAQGGAHAQAPWSDQAPPPYINPWDKP